MGGTGERVSSCRTALIWRLTLLCTAQASRRTTAFSTAPNAQSCRWRGTVSTFNNILTHALQAMWLQRVLTGAVTLPSRAHMEQTVEKDQAWKRSRMPATSDRAAILQLHMTKYHDQLCKDVGVPHRRKGNPLAEMFMPLTARDYAVLFK